MGASRSTPSLLCGSLLAAAIQCVLLSADGSAAPGTPQSYPEDLTFESAEPGLAVRHEFFYYPVEGRSARDLRSRIAASGPLARRTGRRFAAETDYRVSWRFSYSQGPSGCSITTATVSLALTQVYPVWTSPKDSPKRLQRRWKRFLSALREHENGHRDTALDGARSVLSAIATMPPAVSCQELSSAAEAACRSVIRETNARLREEDLRTGHGRTQGARL